MTATRPPAGLRLRLGTRVAGRLRARWRRASLPGRVGLGAVVAGLLGAASLAAAFLAFLVLDALFPFPWAALERPASIRVDGADGEPLRLFLAADERWRLPVGADPVSADPASTDPAAVDPLNAGPLAGLGDLLPAAVVAAEDRRFGQHPGVDPLAVARAVRSNLRAGRVVSGASTLPMQVARMADPAPRTLASKLREAFRALQLSWHRDGDEILALWLDLAPFGGNLEGVGAASWFYFGKEPAALSAGEVALLVALPRSPVATDPTAHPEAARAARDRVLERLVERRVVSAEEAAHARRQPLPTRRRPVPFEAPHFARFAAAARPDDRRVETSLDRRLQALAEAQVARHVPRLRGAGVEQAAVVVVDVETREVRAWVGSAGFLEAGAAGQVDGVRARRSPGSTLKPFLYALAFDRGLATPEGWLLDVPTDFSGYVAENYDGLYRGRVSARESLARSLNAPAVRLLSQVGLEPFHRLLVRGGLATLDRPPGSYGLPLILGAGEVTLADLTNLYATLAEGGLHRPLRWSPPADGVAADGAATAPPPERLVSEGAARLVVDILTTVTRPDLPEAWDLTRGVPAVAWKTGTSYGHRDAWAVGASRRWAVGVWVGSFGGEPLLGISGSEHAGPLLFDLFRALDPQGAAPPGADDEPAVAEVARVEVCTLSRQLPGPHCRERERLTILPGRTRLEPCPEHRRVPVDAETGHLLGAGCLGDRPLAWRVVAVPPAELAAWWRAEGRSLEPLPAPSPECPGGAFGRAPRIVSPDASTPYRLRSGAPREHQKIALTARVDPGARSLWWYQNGRLVARVRPDEPLFLELEPGRHRLVVSDDAGRSDEVVYEVEGRAPRGR